MKRFKRFLGRLGITGAMLVIVPVVVALMWLRYFGLPTPVKNRLLRELQDRGLAVTCDRVLLDPSGGVIVNDLILFKSPEQKQIWLSVDRARIGLAWLSWWRGQPLLQQASVTGAEISYPLGDTESVTFTNVNANVVVAPKEIDVISAEARLLDFQLFLRGRIHLDGFVKPVVTAPGPNATPEEKSLAEKKAHREKLWRTFRSYATEIQTSQPIGLEATFDVSTLNPDQAKADLGLIARQCEWRGAPIEELSLSVSMKEGLLSLDDFRVRLPRGELAVQGEWRVSEKFAQIDFNSNLDFTPLASAFGPKQGEVIRKLSFHTLPLISGRCRLDWTEKFGFDLQADLDWRDFSYADVPFERLSIPLAYDGKRLLVPDAAVTNGTGGLNFDVYFDGGKTELKAKLKSDLDITSFKGILGEGFDRFLASCAFQNGGPQIQATATGTSLKTEDWNVKGHLAVGAFSYKDVAFTEASSDFTFAEAKLALPNLLVKRTEGQGSGAIIYDFNNRSVELKNLVTSVEVQQVAPVLGPKFMNYVKPYKFNKPPAVKVNGVVDLMSEKPNLNTDLQVDIDSNGQMEWELFRVPFLFQNPKGRLKFLNRHMSLVMSHCDFLGGKLNGTLGMNMAKPDAQYETSIKLTDVNFDSLMRTAFKYDKTTGTMNATGDFSGTLGKMETMRGSGEVTITDGYLTTIPFLGGLSELVSAIIPTFGYAKASRAASTFTVANGLVETKDMEITSTSFALIGNGRYNFIKDDLDLDMRVNVRGIVGLVLYTVSKLFEYHGSGSMHKPHWEPKNF